MNRTIKFRGRKNSDPQQWLYGLYVKLDGLDFIFPEEGKPFEEMWHTYYIDPDTIGQFTGLVDKHGTEIYEGDIVKHRGYNGMQTSVVKFEAGAFIVGYHDGSSTKRRPMLLQDKVEVIGNIHDNPELI